MRWIKRLAFVTVPMLCVLIAWQLCFAAADYDARGGAWQVVTVLTGSVKRVLIPENDVTIVHLNRRDDGTTASAATDHIVVMRDQDNQGAAVTMAANFNDGIKCPIFAGGSATFRGIDVPRGVDGDREIQIQAVGNGAKVLIIRGGNSK